MSKIGLVTVLYKSDEMLEGFFRSISAQVYRDYILYLVDNTPNENTDAVISRCRQQYPVTALLHLKSEGNIGVAAGNNRGIHAALNDGCSHVLLLNNDIEFEQDHVFSVLVQTASAKQVQLVVPKIYYYPGKKIWMAGGTMNRWRALGIHHGYQQEDGPAYSVPGTCTYAPTCFMLIAKEVFTQTGYMDEWYFAYYDDTDFVYRALQKKFVLYYEPSVNILHKVSSSSGGDDSLFYIYYANRNKLYFIRKNFSGLVKVAALLYTFLTRFTYLFRFDRSRRRELIRGMKEGFRQPIRGKG